MLVKFKLVGGDEVHINALQVAAVVVGGLDGPETTTFIRTVDGCEYEVADESSFVLQEINHYQRP